MPQAHAFPDSRVGFLRRDAFAIPNPASLPITRLHLLNLFKFRLYFIPERMIARGIRWATRGEILPSTATAIACLIHAENPRNLRKCPSVLDSGNDARDDKRNDMK